VVPSLASGTSPFSSVFLPPSLWNISLPAVRTFSTLNIQVGGQAYAAMCFIHSSESAEPAVAVGVLQRVYACETGSRGERVLRPRERPQALVFHVQSVRLQGGFVALRRVTNGMSLQVFRTVFRLGASRRASLSLGWLVALSG
jgi:hypothetical protein